MDRGWRGSIRPPDVPAADDRDRRAEANATADAHASGERYTLAELTEATGVSVRTVRYYIAEGLLPPPVGSGPRSFYTGAHRDRLRLIGRLRERYLPLKEIRRQLDAWTEADIRRLARGAPSAGTDPDSGPSQSTRSALRPGSESESAPGPDAESGPQAKRTIGESAADYAAALLESPPGVEATRRWGAGQGAFAAPARAPGAASAADADEQGPGPWLGSAAPDEASGETWRRFRLGDDAELLVRASAYERRRERIEWLVRWAAKVFR